MTSKVTRSGSVALSLVLLLFTAACGGQTASPSDGTGSPSTSAGDDSTDDTFVAAVPGGLGGVVSNWDPATMYDPSLPPLSQVYERLTRYDANANELLPELATEWSSSDDGLTWTFQLRPDVTFHTGRALTSEAVRGAIERTSELDQGAAYIWAAIDDIETPDDLTIIFHLANPAPLDLISSSNYGAFIYDTEAAGDGDLADWFATGEADAGTGPYTVESWDPGEQVELTLAAYPDYWGGWDSSHFERAAYIRVTEPNTAVQLAQSGEVTYIQSLPEEMWTQFEDDPGFQTPTQASLSQLFILFNTASGPLSDPLVRQAVAYGLDYEGILAVQGTGYVRTPGIVPAGITGYFPDSPMYEYDPDRARELLEEAGVADEDLQLTITYNNTHADQELTTGLINSTLTDIGFDVEVRGLEGPAVVDLAQSADPAQRQDISFLYWEPDYPDPWNFFSGLFASSDPPVWNWAYYDNPEFDSLLEEASTLLGEEREVAFSELQEMLYEDVPGLVLYTVGYRRVLAEGVQGYGDNPSYPHVVFVYELQPN